MDATARKFDAVREDFWAVPRVVYRDGYRIMDLQRQAELDKDRIEELEAQVTRNQQNSEDI